MNFTVLGLWQEMGNVARAVVVVLVAMSVYSLAISVERIFTYRRARAMSAGYLRALAPLIGHVGELEAARDLDDKYRGSPVARVVGTGVSEFVKGMDVRRAGTGS